jgi:ribonuclease HI
MTPTADQSSSGHRHARPPHAVLRYGTREKEIYGGEADRHHYSNNRMELMAPIRALESLTRVMRLHTDSKYLLDGVTKWLLDWSGTSGA